MLKSDLKNVNKMRILGTEKSNREKNSCYSKVNEGK